MPTEFLVAIDIETTGINPVDCDIIEIAAVKFADNHKIDRFQRFVRPSKTIPLRIQRMTGINEQMVADAPECSLAVAELKDFVGNSVVVGHNIGFDLAFLSHHLQWFKDIRFYDTLQLARFAWPSMASYRLESLVDFLSIELAGQPHRAEFDALAAVEIFSKAATTLRNSDKDLLLKVLEMAQPINNWTYKEFFTQLILGCDQYTPKKSAGIFPIQQCAGENGHDTLFSNHENVQPKELTEFFSSEQSFYDSLNKDGGFSQTIPDFQYRAQQVAMLKEILACFKNHHHAVIEAGTGTGKSLAYLLPAIYWNAQKGRRVVISTQTINLQEQLMNKDIPTIETVLGRKLKAAIVKGRANYLCRKKWEYRIQEKGWQEERELNFFVKSLFWLAKTLTGDKSEINLRGEEQEYWMDLAGEAESCLGHTCRWYNACYGIRARKNAEAADFLIVNHSLVFSDIKSSNNVLPEYKYIVLDEAHHLEESATEYLGHDVSGAALLRMLRNLKNYVQEGRPGLLSRIRSYLTDALQGHPDLLKMAGVHLEEAFVTKSEVETGWADFYEQAILFLEAVGGNDDYNEPSARLVRIKSHHIMSPHWASLRAAGDNLLIRLNRLTKCLEKLDCCFLEDSIYSDNMDRAGLSKELQYLSGFLKGYINEMKFILAVEDSDFVYWFQMSGHKKDLIMKAAPIKISGLLWEKFFKEKNSVILTSATLSVDGNFEHYVSKTGLDLAPPECVNVLYLAAPFEYEKQSLLCVVNDLPNPPEVEDSVYAEEIAPVLARLSILFQGRTLCLFSSHRLLRETHEKLSPLLENEGITVLGHNIDGGRKGLIEEFKKNGKAILLGASSFWEGVDLTGDMLSCVVIAKLPFSPPTIPTVEARVEQMAAEKVDGFYHYSLPQAVIRLKQGFGRLIRNEKDTGAVVILDKRTVQKRYGRVFLRSLPIKHHFKGDRFAVVQKIRDWMEEGSQDQNYPQYINDFKDIEKFIKSKSTNKKGQN